MKNFEDSTQKQYVLAKFEPGNILLINRYTKKAFNYYQIKKSQPILQQLIHPYLMRPLIYGTGLLYPKAQSNMKIELQNRKRAFNKQNFGEDELINTFLPLFQCLTYLHKNKVIHGQIHPENIVMINDQIKIRDWLVEWQQNVYYGHPKKQNKNATDDLIAMGQILAQFATLRKSSNPFQDRDVDLAIESVIQTYSKQFIFLLMILLKKRKQFFNQIIPLMQSKTTTILDNYELNELYSKIKTTKAGKVIKPFPIQKIINIAPTPKKSENILIQSSPNKKFNITHTSKKSTNRLDDTENKKIFNQEVKKRQIEKITKIIQRSNAFVNQLMARKNNNQLGALKNNSQHNGLKNSSQLNGQQVLKKISGKNNVNLGVTMTNMSMYTVQPTKKVKQTTSAGLTFSPNKRMRTISRKK